VAATPTGCAPSGSCHNPEAADRPAAVRERLIAHLDELITGSDTWTARRRDELVGSPVNQAFLAYTPASAPMPMTAKSNWRPWRIQSNPKVSLTPSSVAT
jgi:hypothetical protein